MAVKIDNIPDVLREKRSWVLWRLEERGGKQTKIPYQVNGKKAKSNDASTWSSYADVVAAYLAGGYDGIGINMVDDLVGVDLDKCREGDRRDAAVQIVEQLDSYTEISPSGTGIRVFVCGKALHTGKGLKREDKAWVEVYDASSPRFLTVTGDVRQWKNPVRANQPGLEWLHEKWTKRPEKKHTPSPVGKASDSDEELLEKIRRSKRGGEFEALYRGELSTYSGDHSSGDIALCNLLAFWCRRDPGQMDRIFRSSGLMREKWDRPTAGSTYGAMTIDKAIEDCREVYEPERRSKGSRAASRAASREEERTGDRGGRDWQADLIYTYAKGKKTGLKSTLSNLVLIIKQAPAMRGVVLFNEFVGDVVSLKSPPWNEEPYASDLGQTKIRAPWEEEDYSRLQSWLEREWEIYTQQRLVFQAVLMAAKSNSFNPLQQYFESLTWDGELRLDSVLIDYCGAPDTEYTRMATRYWMISAVARAMNPGCKVDSVLILEGPQGIGKSTFFRLIAKEWGSDSPVAISSKDTYMLLRECWIAELAELETLMKSDSRESKAFFTRNEDKFRPPYARKIQTFKRQCVFGGTVNEDEYLDDPTGNRRYWPVSVSKVDVPGLRKAIDAIWAEAYAEYQEGAQWWPTEKEYAELFAGEAQSRVLQDPWAALIGKWISDPDNLYRVDYEVEPSQLLIEAVGLPARDINRSAFTRVGVVMNQLDGWYKTRITRAGMRMYVWKHRKYASED